MALVHKRFDTPSYMHSIGDAHFTEMQFMLFQQIDLDISLLSLAVSLSNFKTFGFAGGIWVLIDQFLVIAYLLLLHIR